MPAITVQVEKGKACFILTMKGKKGHRYMKGISSRYMNAEDLELHLDREEYKDCIIPSKEAKQGERIKKKALVIVVSDCSTAKNKKIEDTAGVESDFADGAKMLEFFHSRGFEVKYVHDFSQGFEVLYQDENKRNMRIPDSLTS